MKNLFVFIALYACCLLNATDYPITHHDMQGRLTSYEAAGYRATFSYDEQGRIATVSENNGKSVAFTYQKEGDAVTCLVRTYINNVMQKRTRLEVRKEHIHFLAYDDVDSADSNAPVLQGKWFAFTPQTVTVGWYEDGKKILRRIYKRRKLHPKSLVMTPEMVASIHEALKPLFSELHEKARELFLFTKKSMEWFFDGRAQFEGVAFAIIDEKFWTFLGYNPDPVCEGKWEAQEPAPNIRITHINGILSKRDKIHNYAQMISQAHGDVAVYYIYLATEGFSSDVMRALFAKMGVISPQARLLAKLWERLIKEMGGVTVPSTIIHYAHSLGGAESANALALLSPEERSHVRITTIGSPLLIADESTVNYVAFRDGVPLFDPIGYLQALFGIRENVIFIGSRQGVPFVDHFLTGETYQQLIEDLGRKFREGNDVRK